MNAEEVEHRLLGLETPAPSEALRLRVLDSAAGRSPKASLWKRQGWAVAASLFLAGLLVWLAVVPPAGTGLPGRGQEDVGALIERLGREDYDEREKASAAILALGESARAALEAARSHRDPEVAASANRLLGELNRRRHDADRPKRIAAFTSDPALRAKLEKRLKDNPGKGILVCELRELKDGVFQPVRSGFAFSPMFEDARLESDPLRMPPQVRAEVEEDGMMFFLLPPGRYGCMGYHDEPCAALAGRCFTWEHPARIDVDELGRLPAALLTPWIECTSPVEGGVVTLTSDPRLAWQRYPEVATLDLGFRRTWTNPDGSTVTISHGMLKLDAPNESSFLLKELFQRLPVPDPKVDRPFRAGDTVSVTMKGFAKDGREIARSRKDLKFDLRD